MELNTKAEVDTRRVFLASEREKESGQEPSTGVNRTRSRAAQKELPVAENSRPFRRITPTRVAGHDKMLNRTLGCW